MKTLDDLVAEGVTGRTVLVRSDLNVPLDGGHGSPTTAGSGPRVPTIRALLDAGARVVVAAHLGRPKAGADNAKYSLAPVAGRLGELLGTEVTLANDGDGATGAADVALTDGGVVLLENIRFDPRETSKDAAERGALAAELAALAGPTGAFVSDGFGVVHRKQASVYDVAAAPARLHRRAGAQRGRRAARGSPGPERPYAVVLGGSKVSDKLGSSSRCCPGRLAAHRRRDVLHLPGGPGARCR